MENVGSKTKHMKKNIYISADKPGGLTVAVLFLIYTSLQILFGLL